MLNKRGVFVVVALFAFSAASFAVTNQAAGIETRKNSEVRSTIEIKTITNNNLVELSVGQSDESQSQKLTLCDGDWMGTTPLFSLGNWFTGFEYYAQYQDPTETGCPVGTTYPFRVDTLKWHVYNPLATGLTVTIQGMVWDVDYTNPTCPKPGPVICYSPMYTVNLPPGPGGVLISLEMVNGCCVYGPYYAGVFVPDFFGAGFLDVVVDSAGTGGTFGANRTCANYNNYRGFHEDLITGYSFPGNLRLWSVGMASDMNTCDQCAQAIEPGIDLWTTPPGSSFDNHFSTNPIPADFFDPGSDPFTGNVTLGGDPLGTAPSGILGPTDAIVRRNDTASLPAPGATDVIDIEIVALSLTSTQPIVVTYNGGQNPELWDVRVTLSSAAPQQPGQMTINKECCNGGTFESTLPVTPKFIFTRQGDNFVRELDLGALPIPPIQFQTQNGHWSYDIPAPFDILTCPGLVLVDHDLSPSTPDVILEPSSKFTPGFRTLPCDPGFPDQPYCGGKVLTLEQEMLAQHGVLPPQETTPVEGACCLPDGSCVITTPECCATEGGEYQGDGVPCSPDLCTPPDTNFALDTLCSEAEITLTPSPTDPDCLEPLLPITVQGLLDTPLVVRRAPDTPYTAGEIIQTEILQMELTSIGPPSGVIVRAGINFGLPPSTGTVNVGSTDGSGNLTGGTSFFDVYVEITLPGGQQLINLDPIPLEATLSALPPPPGTQFTMPPSAPPIELFDDITLSPSGFLCQVTHTIIQCVVPCCILPLRGDMNYDGDDANILDLTFAVDRIFRGGPPPVCPEEGDPNTDGDVCNILDLTMLVDRIFRGGQPPDPC